jgi:hypothetical protein
MLHPTRPQQLGLLALLALAVLYVVWSIAGGPS